MTRTQTQVTDCSHYIDTHTTLIQDAITLILINVFVVVISLWCHTHLRPCLLVKSFSFPLTFENIIFIFSCICVSENFLLWCDGLMDGRVFLLSTFFSLLLLLLSREMRENVQGFSCFILIIFFCLSSVQGNDLFWGWFVDFLRLYCI